MVGIALRDLRGLLIWRKVGWETFVRSIGWKSDLSALCSEAKQSLQVRVQRLLSVMHGQNLSEPFRFRWWAKHSSAALQI